MSAAIAWIIPLPGNFRVAVGAMEFVHVLTDAPAKTAISDGPAFMREAVSWDGGIVPVFDAGRFSHGIEKRSDTVYYGIVRYRSDPNGRQQYGAFKMIAIPQRVAVDDKMACDLPDDHESWRPFSVSCFKLDDYSVPILDLARLFSQASVNYDNGADSAAGRNDPDPSGYTDSLATT